MTGVRSKLATFGIGAKGYVRSHWLGQQSLAMSFWVNLALLRAIIFHMEGFAGPLLIGDLHAGAVPAVVLFVVADALVYAWQVVGVVRACDRYLSAYGSITLVWAAHLGIVVSFLFTLISVFTAVQNPFGERDEELLSFVWERERAAKYSLTLSDDSSYVYLDGSFELSITKSLRALLQQNPKVTGIVLASQGGNIFEGRGVAQLIHRHGLDTYVFGTCYSACTTAFIAGETRTLGPGGELGFHQYGLEADYQVPFVDIAGEQSNDREFYRSQKITEEFLDRVFDATQSDLWVPSTEELLEAGAVHRIDAEVQ